ncbi:MAG: DNA primase [Paludibacteraceae bacterium]|nr:DNA primase [Paludibacteraceae bacterium]
MIPRETIDRIFSAARIEDVVGDYVSLKKRGANLIGLCPFHDEKTGSFTVSPSKGIFKCFGCGKAGHSVGFIMEIEQCSYIEAIRQLAKKYHIEIEERELTAEEKQKQDDRESMFVVNEFANKWFHEQLWDTPEGSAIAMSYLRQRGLREDIIRKFQIGYSPEKTALWPVAQKKGFIEKYLLNDSQNPPYIGTGICGKSENGKLYDRFRGRVMFPFLSISGKVVGFSGRLMVKNDKVGKYVNSPTSLIYEKHNELFGLYQAKQAISKSNSCYLVEGQMDVIQLVQSGIDNVVASGGTALTINQIRLIHRFTENIILLYDGDKAGIKAALRGIDMMLEEGINVRVILLPEGEDPDSFAKSHNASDLKEFLDNNQHDFIRFKTQLLMEEAQSDPNKRSEMILQVVRSIAIIPDIIKRQVYIKDTASILSIPENVLTRKVIEIRKKEAEERKKRKETEQRQTSPQSTEDSKTENKEVEYSAMVHDSQENQQINHKERNILNLLQVLIRYGERVLYQTDDQLITVGEYIITEIKNDSIDIPNPLYQQVIHEYCLNYQSPNFMASTFFQHHPNAAISQLAVDMIADKYQISRMYSKRSISENVVQEVQQDEVSILPELVQRLLLELKYTVVDERIDSMQRMLKEAQDRNDWQLVMVILEQQPQLMEIRKQLCRALGNRVIVR